MNNEVIKKKKTTKQQLPTPLTTYMSAKTQTIATEPKAPHLRADRALPSLENLATAAETTGLCEGPSLRFIPYLNTQEREAHVGRGGGYRLILNGRGWADMKKKKTDGASRGLENPMIYYPSFFLNGCCFCRKKPAASRRRGSSFGLSCKVRLFFTAALVAALGILIIVPGRIDPVVVE